MKNRIHYLLWLSVFYPSLVLAQGTPKLEQLIELVQVDGPLYNFMVALGYSLSIAGIVYAGVIYFLPGSSEDKPTRSKQAIIAVATGLAIIVMSKVIVSIAGADELLTK